MLVAHTYRDEGHDEVVRIISARTRANMSGGSMKKAKPSRRVKAEIVKLAALPDRDIDFDDIPEIHDWSGAVRGGFFRPVKRARGIHR